jgi:hypothetical protein
MIVILIRGKHPTYASMFFLVSSVPSVLKAFPPRKGKLPPLAFTFVTADNIQ